MTDQSTELREFIHAADTLRSRWLNDGHEMRDPSASEFREARQRYDAARLRLTDGASASE